MRENINKIRPNSSESAKEEISPNVMPTPKRKLTSRENDNKGD